MIRIKKKYIIPFVIYTFPSWNLISEWIFGDSITFAIWRLFALVFIFYINFEGLHKKRKEILISDILILGNAMYLLLNGRDYSYFFNNDVYLFWLLMANIFFWGSEQIEFFRKYIISKKYIAIVNAYLTIITCILSIFLNKGFVHAQGTVVFTGFFSLEHLLAYHILVSYMLLLIVDKSNHYIVLKLLLSCFLVLTAVRSAVIVLSLLLLYDYFTMKKRQRWIMLFLVCFLIFVFYITGCFEKIPLFTKTKVAVANGDATNGRGVLAMIGFNYYLKYTSGIQKIMGIGIDNIRQNVYWNNLHAHNDVVNILLGYGALYLGVVIAKIIRFCKGRNSVIIFLVIASLAYFNGFYMYMEAVVALPIIKISLSSIKINKFRIVN